MPPEPTQQRPRVWFVAAQFGLPSQVWMHRQAARMRRLDLRVLTHDYHDPVRYPADGFEAELLDSATPMPSNRLLAQLRLAWYALKNRSLGGFRGSPAEARQWADLARRDRPRAALCQFGTTAVRFAPLLSALGVPVVAHFHGYDLTAAMSRRAYVHGLRRWAPRFTECVVVAEYQRRLLLGLGVPPERVHVVPCGAPMNELRVADRVEEQPCRFLMVGRLTDKKRPDLSLRAFARCRERAPDSRLTVIGDGPLMGECRSLAAELGLGDSVEWLGAQPIDVVKQRLSGAGAFVQHSVTAASGDMEGWPVAIAEAAGSGLPVVSTRHASIPEQVEHEKTGLLCDELDWRTMGDHLARLAENPTLRAQMGHAAREKLLPFDSVAQIERLEDLLLGVAERGPE